MTQQLERRVERLEAEQDELGKSLNQLNTTLALLNQSVTTMADNEKAKKEMLDKGILFVIFAFGASFITWIIRGGLA